MGFKEAWAGLTQWQRRRAMFGMALAAITGVRMLDARVLRPDEYKEYWQELEDRRRAQQLEKLMLGQPDTLLEHFISQSSRPFRPSPPEAGAGSSSPGITGSTARPAGTTEGTSQASSSSSSIAGNRSSVSTAANPASSIGASSRGADSTGQAQEQSNDAAGKPRRAWWRLW